MKTKYLKPVISVMLICGTIVLGGCATEKLSSETVEQVEMTSVNTTEETTEGDAVVTSEAVEKAVFVYEQEEPKYEQVFYSKEEVDAFVDKCYEELSGKYPEMTKEDMAAFVGSVNAFDLQAGVYSDYAYEYGMDYIGSDSDEENSHIDVSDFVMNEQAKEYSLVLEDCFENDYPQWEDYMTYNTDRKYDYDFKYSCDIESENTKTAIAGVRFYNIWFHKHGIPMVNDATGEFADWYSDTISEFALNRTSFE